MDSWDRSFSWSKMRTYDSCPRRFKYQYIDELDEIEDVEDRDDGINFHEYMAEYYRVMGMENEDPPAVDTSVTLAKEMFSPELQAKYRPWIEQWHYWNEQLYEKWGPKHWTPVFVEEWVEVEWQGDTHHGYIDRIQWHPGRETYGVIDYKPNAKDGSNIKGQTAYYAEILLEVSDMLDEPVDWAGCYGYTTGNFKMWDIHWRSTKASKRKIAALKQLDEGFEPNFGYHCDWCDYQEECTMEEAEKEGLLEI